uniref:RPN13_C domain-containing protein n=1 Tax=Heterorhabditis bacteriophora TaxID=37862 RepID=A0A1I7XN79_HETBA
MPKAIEALNQMFNHSRIFYETALNMTTTENPVFTETELEQMKSEDPVITTLEMGEKKKAAETTEDKSEEPVAETNDNISDRDPSEL